MARKKKTTKKPVKINRDMVKLGEVNREDFCYFISSDNAKRFGQVIRIFEKDQIEPAMQMQCQSNWSFHIVPIRLCAWDEKSIKGLKWDIKANLSRGDDE